MGRILTQQEVENRLNKINLKLLSGYINSRVPIKVQCYCGNIFNTIPKTIFSGDARSCGCYNSKINSESKLQDISGRKFGKLLVLNILPKDGPERKYRCLCDCGNETITSGKSLKNGDSISCRCIHKNPNLTYEDRQLSRKTPEHINWIKIVLKKYNYICDICKQKGGKLNAHHLDGYHWCKERRLDVQNGVCLCKSCHKKFHSIYGNKHNTKEQYLEYKGMS